MGIREAKEHIMNLLAAHTPDDPKVSTASVWCGLARLVVGRDTAKAFELLDDGLAAPCMFTVPAYIRTMIRHRDDLPDALAERIAAMLTDRMSYGGLYDSIHTENHKVMLATSRLLVAQHFPDGYVDGTRASVAYTATLDWLQAWIRSRCIYGHIEAHSPVYSMTYTMPFLNLRDCATDPHVRSMAEMVVDWVAMHHAVSHLDSMYAGGHSRAYDEMIVNTQAHPSQHWAYIFYGLETMHFEQSSMLMLTAADSDYVPHPAIIDAAVRRNSPYEMRERHAEAVSNGVPLDIQRYTWMTDAFALSSMQGAAWPDHQLRWSLKIAGDDPHATVIANQPGKSEKWETWNGASEYEHVLQHKGAIVVTYNIPETDPHPTIRAHLPGEATAWSPNPEELGADNDPQWLFFHTGETFVAVYPISRFGVAEDNYNYVRVTDAVFAARTYWQLTSDGPFCGLVLEPARAAEWPSFASFVAAISQSVPQVDNVSGTVRYTALDGARMSLTNPGPDEGAESFVDEDGTVPVAQTHAHYRSQRPRATFSIDGASPTFADWPTIECPFANCEFGSGSYRVGSDDSGIELEFREWSKRVW